MTHSRDARLAKGCAGGVWSWPTPGNWSYFLGSCLPPQPHLLRQLLAKPARPGSDDVPAEFPPFGTRVGRVCPGPLSSIYRVTSASGNARPHSGLVHCTTSSLVSTCLAS